MSLILGLDLGSGSIGWAVINYSEARESLKILNVGTRIIPIDGSTLSNFDTGQAITVNADRTAKRTMRKMLNRYQDRRNALQEFLKRHGMMPDLSRDVDRTTLWGLRSDAVTRQLTLQEIGRVLLLISRKRGYNASKADLSSDDKTTQGYVADVKNRYLQIKELGKTVGQYFYERLLTNPDYRIKNQVYPRQAYIEEFDAIIDNQKQYYPEVFTDDNINHLRNYILFYQRPLKSCKHLVGNCEFETRVITKDGREITVGPKVAHCSNPLFQLSRILQVVNNIQLTNRCNPQDKYILSKMQRALLIKHLQENDKLKASDINSIIFNKKTQRNWLLPDNIGNGIPGDKTRVALRKALGNKYKNLLQLDIDVVEVCDKNTGAILLTVSPDVIEQPLYRLWHTIYSISDPETLRNTLKKNFNIDDDTIEKLIAIDFTKESYGNMSEKALKKLLPHLIEGDMYSVACQKAGYRHSDSLTAEENQARELSVMLDPIKKGELRQPIVEKILNQLVNVVNALTDRYGEFDEIHIELARELKLSREERNSRTKSIRDNERTNNAMAKRIADDYRMTPTKTRINKMKLWEETDHLCIYCGQPVSVTEFLQGFDVEVEHIIPKSLLFDDSFSNKVCSCGNCNHSKGNLTAYDFMRQKGEETFHEYITKVQEMFAAKKISKTKRDHLLMSQADIPTDFIERQLRESQYIARRAKEMLETICRRVVSTSGSVTDFLRHIWGWDRVLHDINLPRYAQADLVEEVEGSKQLKIKDWSKRCDHRHHAIDALAIACTTQSIIQRLNNLSSLKDVKFKPFDEQGEESKSRQSALEQYVNSLPHFTYAEVLMAIEALLVSLKQNVKSASKGKRYVYSRGKRKCVQQGIIIPRGPLHEETIYGRIQRYDKKGNLYYEYVVKYPIESIKSEKDALSIVDKHIRELVLERLRSVKDAKKAFAEPLYSDKDKLKQIKTVRCFTGLKSLLTVKKDDNGRPIGFAKPGTNHHVAIYVDKQGVMQEHIVSFKHCIDRIVFGIPLIITNPSQVWSEIITSDTELPQEFLSYLPQDDWEYKMCMRRNELFIIGMTRDEVEVAIKLGDKTRLNACLYRVQSLSSKDYFFSLCTQTQYKPEYVNKPDKRFLRIRSMDSLTKINPIKVKVDLLGNITLADD